MCAYVFSCSFMSDSETPWTAAHQAPLSMELSKQEYWSGWPYSSPVYLPDPGIKPTSPVSLELARDSLPLFYQENWRWILYH